MRKILILAENDGGAGEREGRGGDGDSNEVIGAGGGVLLVIGLGGVLAFSARPAASGKARCPMPCSPDGMCCG